jgi:hypothetical protein
MSKIADLIAPYFTPGARYELTAPVENPCADRRRKGRSPLICERTLPAGLRFTVSEDKIHDGRDGLYFADMRRHDGFIEAVGRAAMQVSFTEEEEFENRTSGMSAYYAGLAVYQAALRLGVDQEALWREVEWELYPSRRGEEK